MADSVNLAYQYDGSFDGLLCCVFESYEQNEIPAQILKWGEPTLYPTKAIASDSQKAGRVLASIPRKMGQPALQLVRMAFLTCLEEKERMILLFLRLGYRHGPAVTSMLADDVVNTLFKAVKRLTNESYRYQGFVRFSVINGVLVSEIEPENFVLPLLAPHFCKRLANERFFIHDQTHGMALVYEPGRRAIIPADRLELPPIDQEEAAYRRLWQLFYDTIAIQGRINPRGRMGHLPKRYWKNMTELAGAAAVPHAAQTAQPGSLGKKALAAPGGIAYSGEEEGAAMLINKTLRR